MNCRRSGFGVFSAQNPPCDGRWGDSPQYERKTQISPPSCGQRLGVRVVQQVRCPRRLPVKLSIDTAAGRAIMGLRRCGGSLGRTGRVCPRSKRIFPKSFPQLPAVTCAITKWPRLLGVSYAERELQESRPLRHLCPNTLLFIGIIERNACPALLFMPLMTPEFPAFSRSLPPSHT